MQPFRMPPAVGQFPHDAGGGPFVELSLGFVHNGGPGRSDSCDVLQKQPLRTAIVCDPQDLEEQAAAFASKAGTPAGDRQVLARETRHDDIHRAAKRPAVEGREIVPDKSRIQGLAFHPCHESGRCVGFPLNEAHSSILESEIVESRLDAFVEHADAGAEADSGKFGTCNHITAHSSPYSAQTEYANCYRSWSSPAS